MTKKTSDVVVASEPPEPPKPRLTVKDCEQLTSHLASVKTAERFNTAKCAAIRRVQDALASLATVLKTEEGRVAQE